MPTYKITDPSSGKTLKLTGDSPPTEQELNDIFSGVSKDNSNQTTQLQMPAQQNIDTAALVAGGAATVGYGIKAGLDWLTQPLVKKEYKDITGQLKNIQTELPSVLQDKSSLVGTEASFIPKRITADITDLKGKLNLFDETLISINASDLSDVIKKEYVPFIKEFHNNYGKGLAQIENLFEQSGGRLNTDTLTNIIDDTIDWAHGKGIPDDKFAYLNRVKGDIQQLGGAPVELYGPTGVKLKPTGAPMNFTQAKGYVASIRAQNPFSAVTRKLNEKWGQLLEKSSPENIRPKLNQLNKTYAKGSTLMTQLDRVVDIKTGDFNKAKLMKYLSAYTKTRIDEGAGDLLRALAEGTELTPPMEGIKSKFGALQQLKVKRFANEDAIKAQISKLTALRKKSGELLSRANVAQDKLSSRNAVKSLLKMIGLGKKAITMMSVYPAISDAIRLSDDPEGYAYRLIYGGELAPKGSQEREIQTGRLL